MVDLTDSVRAAKLLRLTRKQVDGEKVAVKEVAGEVIDAILNEQISFNFAHRQRNKPSIEANVSRRFHNRGLQHNYGDKYVVECVELVFSELDRLADISVNPKA